MTNTTLEENGFVRMPNFLNELEICHLLKSTTACGFNPIFESIDESGNTYYGTNLRLQKAFKNDKIEERINNLFHSWYNIGYKCQSGHLLCAKDGCPKQSWHRDFSVELMKKVNKDTTAVYGALIALNPRPFSIIPRNDENPILHHLKPGDLLIFGGDVIHRGEDVNEQSFAIHFYCVHQDVYLCNDDYNQTEFADVKIVVT